MFDLRPVGYVIGLLVAVLGAAMLLPMLVDIAEGRGHWPVFAQSAFVTGLSGGLIALGCANGARAGLSIQQAFLLTTGVWAVLPLFGALPFMIGATQLNLVDSYFEAMSGITTTGSTVIVGLDELPKGLLLWRGILQWLGGLGIVIVAIVFLPVMRVGGMQFFETEAFDTLGKVLPRALDISKGLIQVYVGLTLVCSLVYSATGLTPFEATVHAMTTISTGGFSTSDLSFGAFPGAPQYAAALFMILGALPFVRLMQLIYGNPAPLWRDSQIRTFLRWVFYALVLLLAYEWVATGFLDENGVRLRLFNLVSIFTGTGYGAGDVTVWGAMPFTVLFVVGMIGGCTGSTACSIKIFRYQILLNAIRVQVLKIRAPHRQMSLRYDGQTLSEQVVTSVMALFTLYILSLGFLSTGLALLGLPLLDALTAAWTSLFNVGPAFGELVGATGALDALPDAAKWMMCLAMLAGRLELLAVIVLFLPVFWRA
ncbi:TrkH family potassium uptake protein [Rhodosalinus sp. FB01]|uniref:TrkH family potassium uptake protein n=1 Tax=Rhodosalinus sp. FB01 TaxID=3239194 RepID=UPI0035254DCC